MDCSADKGCAAADHTIMQKIKAPTTLRHFIATPNSATSPKTFRKLAGCLGGSSHNSYTDPGTVRKTPPPQAPARQKLGDLLARVITVDRFGNYCRLSKFTVRLEKSRLDPSALCPALLNTK